MPYAGKEYGDRKKPLFHLSDGSPVFFGDVLWHPDRNKVGWCCFARFSLEYEGADTVTVSSPNGAVPTVNIADLRREPPILEIVTCPTCKGSGRIARVK